MYKALLDLQVYMDVQGSVGCTGVHGCTGFLLFGPRSDLETIFLFCQDAILARQKPK